MSASIDTRGRLIRGVDQDAVNAPSESPLKSALKAKISQLRRLFAGGLVFDESNCGHHKLVFDEINDVYCKHCRKDFTD